MKTVNELISMKGDHMKQEKIIVTGATGLVGRALVEKLEPYGPIVRIHRHSQPLAPERFDGVDAVVHLAGEPIAGRWTASKKRRICESRVGLTGALSRMLAGLKHPPRVLVSASATGYYGDRDAEPLCEDSAMGAGFLAGVCRDWERATDPAVSAGIRVVNLRFGIILSRHGGALARMLWAFRPGLGGVIGSGRQFWSWITLEDAVGAIRLTLVLDELRGPVNVVSPSPVTNHEFTKTLGHVLHRPTIMPLPGLAARAVFGQMADELLLASTRVQPIKLEAAGYRFEHQHLEQALPHVIRGRGGARVPSSQSEATEAAGRNAVGDLR